MCNDKNCKAFIEAYQDAKVNCATCKYWTGKACGDIYRALKENSKFDYYDNLMKSNKGVHLG